MLLLFFRRFYLLVLVFFFFDVSLYETFSEALTEVTADTESTSDEKVLSYHDRMSNWCNTREAIVVTNWLMVISFVGIFGGIYLCEQVNPTPNLGQVLFGPFWIPAWFNPEE